jgi:cysteine desulfurase / selenocysteine lyase
MTFQGAKIVNASDYGAEFPQQQNLIYLNHAAVAPWPQRTAKAVEDFARQNVQRGAADYRDWCAVEDQLRQQFAALLNAPSVDDIALLKNTSEALSVVAYGLNWAAGDNVVINNQEFPSNRIVWESLQRLGVETKEAILEAGVTPEDAILDTCTRRTRLVAVSSVQYATGLRMDLERLGAACKARGILLCVDAIQSLGALPMDVQKVQADFLMADGHKWMLGPEGIAVLYCRSDLRAELELFQYGWHMVEDRGNYDNKTWRAATTGHRFECGSPNMLGVHALQASLSLLLEVGMQNISRQVTEKAAGISGFVTATEGLELLSTDDPERRSGIVCFRKRGVESSALFAHLMHNNIVCAPRGGGIRFSPHFYTPDDKIRAALDSVRTFQG